MDIEDKIVFFSSECDFDFHLKMTKILFLIFENLLPFVLVLSQRVLERGREGECVCVC